MDSQQRTAASPRSPPRQGHDSTAILFTLLSFFAIVALVVPLSLSLSLNLGFVFRFSINDNNAWLHCTFVVSCRLGTDSVVELQCHCAESHSCIWSLIDWLITCFSYLIWLLIGLLLNLWFWCFLLFFDTLILMFSLTCINVFGIFA